jgi:large subunit ribosomal protein L35
VLRERTEQALAAPPTGRGELQETGTLPKMKTNRSAKKRFGFTKSGRVKRNRPGHHHILTKKTRKRKRNLRHATTASAVDRKRVVRLLPYG